MQITGIGLEHCLKHPFTNQEGIIPDLFGMQIHFPARLKQMNGDFGRRRKRKCGRGAAGKIYVFGILERGKKVNAEVAADIRGDTLLELVIYKVKRGNLIHID